MPDEIHIDEKNKIIEVISRGIITPKDIEHTKNELLKICNRKGINKVFSDTTRIVSVPNVMDIYGIVKDYPRNFIIAFLIKEPSEVNRQVTFAETVGNNRGFRIKTFTNKKDAKQWLMEI